VKSAGRSEGGRFAPTSRFRLDADKLRQNCGVAMVTAQILQSRRKLNTLAFLSHLLLLLLFLLQNLYLFWARYRILVHGERKNLCGATRIILEPTGQIVHITAAHRIAQK
jgi:hypothetical protein